MNKFTCVFVIYLFTLTITGTAEVKSRIQASNRVEPTNKPKDQKQKPPPQNPKHISTHAIIGNGIVGVSSIAGVDSRNGRYSSIKFYPPIDPSTMKTDKKGNYIFKSIDGNHPMPLRITNLGDGVSGTIEIQPGSVSVSSSAKAGPGGSASALSSMNGFDPWPIPYSHPAINDIFYQPTFPTFPTFPNIPDPFDAHTKFDKDEPYFPKLQALKFPWIQDPWMDKSVYKSPYQRRDVFRPNWYYPSFDPFINFW